MATKEEIKKRQCLLYVVDNGYYVGDIDGIWGTLSKTATRCFKKDFGLADNDTYDAETEKALRHAVAYGMPAKKEEPVGWNGIKYFTKAEFKCECGGKYCNGYPTDIDMNMVKFADAIRQRIGKPIPVNSGLRCKTHNANVGGVSNSQHLYGTAADLGCPSGVTPAKMAAIAEEVMGNTGGIGIYSWGIHIDSRKTKSRWNG